MNTNLIRWTKDDKQNLRKAVNNFNRKVTRLQNAGYKNLPDKVSYKDLIGIKKLQDNEVSQQILSRQQLNNTIKSLQRFTRRGAEEEVTLKSGEKVTKWLKNEIRIKKNTATNNLIKEIGKTNILFGATDEKTEELIGTYKAILDINNRSGYKFKNTLKTLIYNARNDKELRQAKTWADNFRDNLVNIENYENADLLIEKVNSAEFKNPIKLWEYIKQSPTLKDFFTWYKSNPEANTIAGFDSNQEAFNFALEQLGLL